MAHIRKLLRDRVSIVLTGLPTTGVNVYQSRVYPIAANKLPGIIVYSKDEVIEYSTMGLPRTQERKVSFGVEIYVKGVMGYDDALDQISLEVEEALYSDITLNGYAADLMITDFTADFNGTGDQPVAMASLTVEVLYRVKENQPDIVI